MAVLIVCAHCGKEAWKRPAKNRRFCSSECSHAGRNPSPEVRFWERVVKGGEDECWPWTGHTCKGGYGHLGIGKKLVLTHRFSWELHNGPIANGLKVLHRCDNPPCCNPKHLWLGSVLDNNRDRAAKRRNRDQRGDKNEMALLTADDVRCVMELRSQGALQREIAARFGVSRVTISNVLTGTTWAHIRTGL